MHELSLSDAIVEAVVRHAEGRRVEEVNLRVGRLRQVVPDSLDFYFGFVSGGTVCEGARLVHTIVPAELECSACGHRWQLEDPFFWCPACDKSDVEVLSGEEFEITSVVLDESEAG